jgi:hypothetical protein
VRERRKSTPVLQRLIWGLIAWAIITELRKPAEERQWHGRVAGVVPYDFRVPTIDRLRAALWDPSDKRLLKPNPFGVGWTVNLGRAVHVLRDRR